MKTTFFTALAAIACNLATQSVAMDLDDLDDLDDLEPSTEMSID